MVASKKALMDAGLSKDSHPEAYEKLDKKRVGVLVGSGMGGLQVFQDGVSNLVQKVSCFNILDVILRELFHTHALFSHRFFKDFVLYGYEGLSHFRFRDFLEPGESNI